MLVCHCHMFTASRRPAFFSQPRLCLLFFCFVTALFAVFDGHGGFEVAHMAGQHMVNVVLAQDAYAKGNYAQALQDGFLSFDAQVQRDMGMRAMTVGCTAVCTLIKDARIFCVSGAE